MRILLVAAVIAAAVTGWIGSPVASAQSACADLGGTVNPDQICGVHTQNDTYLLDFTFPAQYPDQQAVADYLRQTRDGFVNVSGMPGSRGLPYVLDAKGTGYRSGLPLVGTESLVFEVYQNVGGAHPQTWYQAFNWNNATRSPITFDSLFKPGSKPLDVIYPEVNRYLSQEQGLIDAIPPTAGLDPANYENFAMTDEKLIFFFGQGEMFPESAGAVQASIPRTTVAPMLAL
ncbi:esterase [Mycobacterium neglectum]|uniref:esterase n=1 Tax=Mycobacterium neglectum TaxID=242737 RepID=UPI000BFF0FF1|nr:esterase [Mycobacterium neglectum]